jgi:hypothetical protein
MPSTTAARSTLPLTRPFAVPATALAVALFAAPGCGRDAGPPAPDLPALPKVAVVTSGAPVSVRRGAEAAAVAVVRRYYAALDRLRSRMRAAPLARLLTADCPCRAQVRAIRAARRRGEQFTDRVRVIRLVAHLDRPDLVDVVVSIDVVDAGRLDHAGHQVGPVRTVRNLHRELLLRRVGARWLVDRVIAV